MKKIKWSQSDDSILIECIQKNPNNLLKAFDIAAKKLNRTNAATRLRWYNNLKHSNKVFMLVSNNTYCYNAKTTTKVVKDISSNEGIWKRILKILFK